MSIMNYDLGGNEVKRDASEAIADIPHNRSLIVEQLTAEEPVSPEAVYGLGTIEDVFAHFKPSIEVEFENEDGQPVKETLHFNSVADFSVKKMTEQSPFLRGNMQKKMFLESVVKQLLSNKVLQRALSDPETKDALLTALIALRGELDDVK